MADIDIKTNRSRHIELGTDTLKSLSMGGAGTPKYVGCTATVTRVENGVLIRLTDYNGTTQETIAEAISDITTNEDGSLTFTLANGDTITTESLKGPQGDTGPQGIQGEKGDTGSKGDTGEGLPYGECSTAKGTAAKTVTISSVTSLTAGLMIAVKFTASNTAADPTLQVNSLDAKAIKRYGTTAPSTSAASSWNAGSVLTLLYDGTYWQMVDYNNTTYSAMTESEMQTGTATTARNITAARLKEAVAYHAPVTSVNGSTGDITVTVPTKVSELTNDSGYITGYTETDPTVPSWAKQSSKPSYTFAEIGSKPSTISGYGITDAYTKTEIDGLVSGVLHYKGTKATVSALPSTGNVTGDTWHVTADGSEWAWDGATWQELGTAVDLSGYVPTSRKINGKALTSDITLSASDVSALPSSTAIPSKTSDLTNDSNFVVDASYVHTDNNFTSTEKSKLSGIASGAEVNVQADWNVTSTSSDAYIKNKPTIPTVPTNVSAFTNDAGYITLSDLPIYNGGVS